MYSLTFNNKKVELPKLTRGIVRERVEIAKKAQEQIKGNYDFDTLIEDMYQYILGLLETDKFKELVPHTDVDDIDPNDLEILFMEIIRAYDEKKEQYKINSNKKAFENITKAIPTKELETIKQVAQQMNK